MSEHHADLLTNSLLNRLGKQQISVFGDSHATAFSGLHQVAVHHIGPATAFSLTSDNSATEARRKIFQQLTRLDPLQTAILLSFGEIDCRVHVIRHAVLQQVSIQESTLRSVQNYIATIREIQALGFTVLVLGLSGSGTGMNLNAPKTGREQERNYAVAIFNQALREVSWECGFHVCNMQNIVVNPHTLRSNHDYIQDGWHLNHFPAIARDLQCILLARFLDALEPLQGAVRRSTEQMVRLNHADGAQFSLSSRYGSYPRCGIVQRASDFFFHTGLGRQEAIDLQLENAQIIDELVIHNRRGCQFGRARDLVVEISTIGAEGPTSLELPTSPAFLAGREPTARVSFPPLLCHRIRIRSTAETYLHFSHIEANGSYPQLVDLDQAPHWSAAGGATQPAGAVIPELLRAS
jgi:hypothetical protein